MQSYFILSDLKECPYSDVKLLSRTNNKVLRIYEFIRLYSAGLNRKNEEIIMDNIKKERYDAVYLDLSLFGRLAKKIKKFNPNIKIITFFHNIEKNYAKAMIETLGIYYYLIYPSAVYNEKKAIEYSDKLFCLNYRDLKEIETNYKTSKEIEILPVSFKDDFNKEKKIENLNEKKILLFVGSLFFANLQGINWFLEEIYPFLKGDFQVNIVGKGMEAKKKELELDRDKVNVIGEVADIQAEYAKATSVIAPILSGSGMKVKTGEALKYGKKIFGTSEAFEGYQIENIKSCILCSNVKEFIEKLNEELKCPNSNYFYKESRELFRNKYSYESSLNILENILSKL